MSDTADTIKNLTNGKSLQVYLVNPPYENPTRTIGDYQREQEEARQRHAMFVEQHKQIMNGQKWTLVVGLAAILSGLAACASAWFAFIQIK